MAPALIHGSAPGIVPRAFRLASLQLCVAK
jgi:hypothetical protein